MNATISTFDRASRRGKNSCHRSAFTLIELLVVISILGLMAGLAVPALKNLGKANNVVSASRQVLDAVARARQLAMSQRTTVYMVFVPQNFWLPPHTGSTTWTNGLSPAEFGALGSLLDKQLSGYNYISLRSIGDQPGRGVARYLSEWDSLPEGTFIASNKFSTVTYINDYGAGMTYTVARFYTNSFPFPLDTNGLVSLPYIAFNYLGQLTVDGVNLAPFDEYIPLAQGSVSYARDASKRPAFAAPDISENSPGNSTNSMFNVIHIDRLTGRAVVEQQKVQ